MNPLVAHSTRSSDAGLVPMSSVEDLHDADLDLLLADRLAESADALRAVVARIARFL
jgi:hypothetical protein